MMPKQQKCPYCEDSGIIVRHNSFHGTMFIKCPYCENKKGITPVQLILVLIFTFFIAWVLAVILTVMFT